MMNWRIMRTLKSGINYMLFVIVTVYDFCLVQEVFYSTSGW